MKFTYKLNWIHEIFDMIDMTVFDSDWLQIISVELSKESRLTLESVYLIWLIYLVQDLVIGLTGLCLPSVIGAYFEIVDEKYRRVSERELGYMMPMELDSRYFSPLVFSSKWNMSSSNNTWFRKKLRSSYLSHDQLTLCFSFVLFRISMIQNMKNRATMFRAWSINFCILWSISTFWTLISNFIFREWLRVRFY